MECVGKVGFYIQVNKRLKESCMPQILTLFFKLFFFLSTNYIFDLGWGGVGGWQSRD